MSETSNIKKVDDFSLRQSSPRIGERVIRGTLFSASAFSVLITIGIVWSLLVPAIEFFRQVPIMDFLT